MILIEKINFIQIIHNPFQIILKHISRWNEIFELLKAGENLKFAQFLLKLI